MELKQLRQFIAVAEELSFRRAAERLHLSQPPLTVAIQRLEADLGVVLFDRSRQHVALTPAGQALLVQARRILTQVSESVIQVKRAGDGLLGTLRLSCVASAALQVLPDLLTRFRHDYPGVDIRLTTNTTARQVAELVSGASDVAVLVPPLLSTHKLRLQIIHREVLVLAVPRGHALWGAARVDLAALANEDFIGFESADGHGIDSLVNAACQEAGFLPHVVQQAPQIQTMLAFVAGGAGLALVPSAMRALKIPHIHYAALHRANNPIEYPIAMAYDPATRNGAVAALLAIATRTATGAA